MTRINTTYRRDWTWRSPATSIIRSHLYNEVKHKTWYIYFRTIFEDLLQYGHVKNNTSCHVIRIAASSQEHVPVCITRKKTQADNKMILLFASKLTWLHRNWLGCWVGRRNRLDFSAGDQNWLDFSLGIGIDLVLCGGQKLLGLVAASKLTWILCPGASQLTCS